MTTNAAAELSSPPGFAPAGSAPPNSAPASRPLEPTTRDRLRRLRIPALVVGVVILLALVTAAIEAGSQGGYLDPSSASPDGGMALRVLLQEQGVHVRDADSASSAASAPAAT